MDADSAADDHRGIARAQELWAKRAELGLTRDEVRELLRLTATILVPELHQGATSDQPRRGIEH